MRHLTLAFYALLCVAYMHRDFVQGLAVSSAILVMLSIDRLRERRAIGGRAWGGMSLSALAVWCLAISTGCASAAVPMGAVTQARTALDATTEPIRVIATELTLVGPVLDEACTPVVIAPTAAPVPVPDVAPPAGPFAPVAPAPPAAPAPPQQLLPPAGCAHALSGLDRVSAELDRLQDLLDTLNRGLVIVETAAALAGQ